MEKNISKILVIFVLLIGCNNNVNMSFENELSEKKDAESVAALLYMYSSRNDIKNIQNLFGKTFYRTNDTIKLKEYIINKEKEFGDFKDYKLLKWKTFRKIGTNPVNKYLLIYDVKYEKFEVIEEISLIKENDQIKIIGYHYYNKK